MSCHSPEESRALRLTGCPSKRPYLSVGLHAQRLLIVGMSTQSFGSHELSKLQEGPRDAVEAHGGFVTASSQQLSSRARSNTILRVSLQALRVLVGGEGTPSKQPHETTPCFPNFSFVPILVCICWSSLSQTASCWQPSMPSFLLHSRPLPAGSASGQGLGHHRLTSTRGVRVQNPSDRAS